MPDENFNILIIGDIVGRSGREVISKSLSSIIEEYNIDFVIANGENAAGGFGISSKIALIFLNQGIDVITSGNHIWNNKDILKIIDTEKRILKPANYPENTPGNGWNIYKKNGFEILVINLMGRVEMLPTDCPFRKLDFILEEVSKDKYDISVVDFHAEATSEKIAMGWYADGKVDAIVGTHTHVQTADERVLPKGTAYITDIGMTGAFDSVIGMEKENIIKHFLTQMPAKYKVAKDDLRLQGVIITFSKNSKRCKSILRINYKVKK